MLFYETYFEEKNINRKPLSWTQDKITTNFEQKKGWVWYWAKLTKTTRKLRKSVILRTLLQRYVYKSETPYLVIR